MVLILPIQPIRSSLSHMVLLGEERAMAMGVSTTLTAGILGKGISILVTGPLTVHNFEIKLLEMLQPPC